jgi:hypothetical protein
LIVDNADGSSASDHANWADAKLLSTASGTTVEPSPSPVPTVPSITVALAQPSVQEDGTSNLVYTFNRSGSTALPLSVNYTLGGTAINGTDYSLSGPSSGSNTVTFAAGSSTASLTLDPVADGVVEANESVILTLATGSGYTVGTTAPITGTILNDDQPPLSNDVVIPGRPTTGWTVNASNVGLAALGIEGEDLPVYTGPYEIPAGSVITGVRFTRPVSVHQGNITIERSLFQPTVSTGGTPVVTTTNNNNWAPARGPVTIRDSEFDGSLMPTDRDRAFAAAFIGVANLQRNYIHNLGSGIALYNTGRLYDSLIEHNYVHRLVRWGDPFTTGNHSSGLTIRDFSDIDRPDRTATIRNNRFMADSGNDTGAVFIAAQEGRINNVRVEGNLMEGNTNNLILEANRNGYDNISIINNRFNPSPTAYNTFFMQGGPGPAIWRDNYRFDPSAPSGIGAPVLL